MAAKIVAVSKPFQIKQIKELQIISQVVALASLSAAEPGYGHGYGINAVAYHPYGGYSR